MSKSANTGCDDSATRSKPPVPVADGSRRKELIETIMKVATAISPIVIVLRVGFRVRFRAASRDRSKSAPSVAAAAAHHTVVDLMRSYAIRLPLNVISELLGVPHANREDFRVRDFAVFVPVVDRFLKTMSKGSSPETVGDDFAEVRIVR